MSMRSNSSREESRERESRLVKHHTFSEAGRGSVPMWDSSDPERAPPPLPLNPTASNSPITKPYASSNIEKAAALIASRALETTPSAYTSNPPPGSPDKSPSKPQHRRMHTIQNGTVGRLSDSLERRSPEKALRNLDEREAARTPERSPTRQVPETPTPGSRLHSFIDDENTPPASQLPASYVNRTKQDFDAPFTDLTNGITKAGAGTSIDKLASQIMNIQNIATSLQRDMASLTKRSKDNAGDLLKLQQTSNLRDEDIRKSLQELLSGLDLKFSNDTPKLIGAPDASRSTPNLPLYLEGNDHTPSRRNIARITSPTSFIEREFTASPSMVSMDGAASIAMLEKVLREMATKDGQDKLMSSLELVKAEAGSSPAKVAPARTAIDPTIVQKLEEILVFMKDMKADSGSKALVRAPPQESRAASQLDLYLDGENKSPTRGASADTVNDELVKTLRSVKQSLSQHGGLTNEVKALVRELRGEVLGMGREIARKLDQNTSTSKDLEVTPVAPGNDEIMQVVGQGLAELKEHMHQIVADGRQNTQDTPQIDTAEVVEAVHRALSEAPQSRELVTRNAAQEREEMILAVREAWEDCKPEIALEHFGLERDEILETLKEGLQSYQPGNIAHQNVGVTYEQVLDAVQQGLADFQPPRVESRQDVTEEQIVAAVRQCLQDFEFPLPSINPTESSLSDITRESMIEAVREGMSSQITLTRAPTDLSRTEILDTVREGLSQAPTISKEVEFNREDLFDAIKACLEGEQNPLGGMGERVVDAMHEFLDSMKSEFQQYSAANGRDTEQVLDAVKDGLENLRGEVETYVDRASDVTGKEEIIETVRAGFAAMQVDMEKGFSKNTAQNVDTPGLLDAMEKEFEHLRESLRKTLLNESMGSDKSEILDAIRDLSDDRASMLSSNNNNGDIARLVKEELEHMRTTLASAFVKGAAGPDRDEILDAIREGVENSRSMPRGDGNESILSNTSELLDAFQDGVDNIRADMQKLIDKPGDMSASHEILDTLKVGIEDIRADIDQMKSRSDDGATRGMGQEVMLHDENGISAQLESLKVMITQLRIKVEAMDIGPQEAAVIPSEMRIHRDDLDELHTAMEDHARKDDLTAMHATLRDVQSSIAMIPRDMPDIQIPEVTMPANAACKEDVEAVETLLINMKAKLEEISSPELEGVARATQLEGLEDLVLQVKAVVEESSANMNEASYAEDFTIVQLSLKDLTRNLEEIKDKIAGAPNEGGVQSNNLSKTDLEVLESICVDVKTKLDGFSIPNVEGLATKQDLAEMNDNLKSFREQFESDNDLTAQAFEARKIEHGGLATKIEDVKALVAEVRGEVIGKLAGSEEGIVEIGKVLGMHHDNMEKYATATSIGELTDLVTKGFDAHMEHHTTSKTEMEERHQTLFSRYEEASAELKAQLEEKFMELMTKYDDAQTSNEAKINAMDDRDRQQEMATNNIKGVVDDLRILTDSLGATVTETCERLAEDSKTVFDVVDQSNIKLGLMTESNLTEHSLTREEIAKTLDATSRLEGSLAEQQPVLLAAIKEVLQKVGQHYEHSQKHNENLSRTAEEIKNGVSEIPAAIPPLLPALPATDASPVFGSERGNVSEKYDDSVMHEKLDELVAHAALSKEAYATMDSHHTSTQERLVSLDKLSRLDKLDEIHEKLGSLDKIHEMHEKLAELEKLGGIHDQVHMTAEEISAMVATQTRLMAEHHESKAEEARQAAVALEKRVAQKEQVEADIVRLNDEKNALVESMAALRREHEELSGQTKKLSRDVAKLETALAIRHEEMRDMNTRTETLEKRILEGVMNHARSAKLAAPLRKKKTSPAERDASLSLKRVPSTASNGTAKVSTKPSVVSSAVGMALQKRSGLTPAARANTSARASNMDRRILSTSHVNSRPSEVSRAMILAPINTTGLVSLKRSQSVKSNPSTYLSGRKPSWNANESVVADKENQSVLEDDDDQSDSGASDSGTERRTSLGGTSYMYTDSVLSDSRRSISYASSIGGALNVRGRESIAEEAEEDQEEETEVDHSLHDIEDLTYHEDNSGAVVLKKEEHEESGEESDYENAEAGDELGELPQHEVLLQHEAKYSIPSDSGLGSELPTPDHGTHIWQSHVTT